MEPRASLATPQTHLSEPAFCLHSLAAHGLYVHSIPGRLRMELPGLLGNPLLAQKLNLTLPRIAGVKRVNASAASGRALVEYDEALGLGSILQGIEGLGCLSVCGTGCHTTNFASANTVVDIALEHAVKLGVELLLTL